MRSTSLALRAAWLLLCLAQASSVRAQLQFKSESHGLVITHGQTKVVEYIHSDPQILRPHLTRAHSPSGYMLTRANPPVAGVDAVDHPTMHPGIWLAWGDINGQDFWRNKARIEHVRYLAEPTLDGDRLTFSTENRLLASDGAPLGQLVNHLLVAVRPLGTVIVWQATLKAGDAALKLGDQEEMGFGVRLATPLIEKNGGLLSSSAGLKTASKTWGQPADWCDYAGTVDGRVYGITTFASPKNFRQSWWHNRDYGLSVANPFAKAAMKQGASDPVTIEPNQTASFTFGVILHDAADYNPAAAYRDALTLTR